jgi:hypothetical protein
MISLQALVYKRIAMFRAIGSANNQADHFTKALLLPAHHNHCCDLMGLRFITKDHALMQLHVLSLQQSNPIFHRHYVLDFTSHTFRPFL